MANYVLQRNALPRINCLMTDTERPRQRNDPSDDTYDFL